MVFYGNNIQTALRHEEGDLPNIVDQQGPPGLHPEVLLSRIKLPFPGVSVQAEALCKGNGAADINGVVSNGRDGPTQKIQDTGQDS